MITAFESYMILFGTSGIVFFILKLVLHNQQHYGKGYDSLWAIGYYCGSAGHVSQFLKQKEAKAGCNADSHDDGIPPNNKLLGILPTIL